MNYLVTGVPDGADIAYYWIVENGHLVDSCLGALPDAEVTLTATWEDSVSIARGELDTNAAFRTETATDWFQEELSAIEKNVSTGGSLSRNFVILGDPKLEEQAAELLRPHLRLGRGTAAGPNAGKKSGFFGWLFRSKK